MAKPASAAAISGLRIIRARARSSMRDMSNMRKTTVSAMTMRTDPKEVTWESIPWARVTILEVSSIPETWFMSVDWSIPKRPSSAWSCVQMASNFAL